MPIRFKTPRGTRDLLPQEMRIFRYLESILRETFESFGYSEVQTPIFELFDLFALRSGDEIRNTMFVFETGEGEMALRPEMTAPICRMIVEGKLDVSRKPIKVYYIARCFRYEEPQAGRYREFWQAGCELMGSPYPEADVEVIELADRVLKKLGVKDYVIRLGDVALLRTYMESLGVNYEVQNKVLSTLDHVQSSINKLEVYINKLKDDGMLDKTEIIDLSERAYNIERLKRRLRRYEVPAPFRQYLELDLEVYKVEDLSRDELIKFIERKIEELMILIPLALAYEGLLIAGQRVRLPLRVAEVLSRALRAKGHDITEVIERAEDLFGHVDKAKEEISRLEEIIELLKELEVSNVLLDLGLARGLEYYTGIVFEVHVPFLGAQSQVCGGGRYDKLVAEFGGPNIPAVGLAFGMDRLMLVLEKTMQVKLSEQPLVMVVPVSTKEIPAAIRISSQLRQRGVRVFSELMRRSLKRSLSMADKLGASVVIIVGEKELREGKVVVRYMKERRQDIVKIEDLGKVVACYLKS
ncbi:MAG: hypothetical protein DRN15_04065 [Thermoprotei archaeon]|nr:MAG: hypothetical protein DRN15_04065 [Thermoprotei archaeon]